MLDSYFFVPGDKPKFINKIKNIDSKYFVIDLEESVSTNNKILALELIKDLDIKNNFFVRIPFKEKAYTKDQLNYLTERFNGNIVLPKVNGSKDINIFQSQYNESNHLSIILLVENPVCMTNLPSILEDHKDILRGIGFGSHDFCTSMNMKHDLEHLSFYRKYLIMYAKAYDIDYIDGVDVNIRDMSVFEKECRFVFEAGADGKFLIHPDQLNKMNNIEFLSKEEIEEAKLLYKKFSLIEEKDLDIYEINGKIYEKPHLERIKRIVGMYNQNNN
ncbi:MAG: hypothetical protein K8R53_03870 [Bacteroidales bacterium]|nr:hypothetical protein [Bacteroidales bacterium]